jgi:TRAP-type C4-dicarboxylate transport system permease small subunit
MMSRLERLDEAIDRVETAIVVLFISAMMGIAFLQIFLRNVFATGLTWGDLILRNLVLWIGFIGATLATREGKHINIDAISRSLPPLSRAMVEVCIHLFSCFMCGLLTYASLKFVKNEAEMGAATLINIPAWILEAILPLTFGLMVFRFALRAMNAFSIRAERVQTLDRRPEE